MSMVMEKLQDMISELDIRAGIEELKNISRLLRYQYSTFTSRDFDSQKIDFPTLVKQCNAFLRAFVTYFENDTFPVDENFKVFVNNVEIFFNIKPYACKMIEIMEQYMEIILDPSVDFWTCYELVRSLESILTNLDEQIRQEFFNKNPINVYKLMDIVCTCGDYGFQEKILKLIYWLIPEGKCDTKLAYYFFPDDEFLQMQLLSINKNRFGQDCRTFLNAVNSKNKTVFSIKAKAVYGESAVIFPPEFYGSHEDVWVDFNVKSESISIQCTLKGLSSEVSSKEDTMFIYKTIIDNINIKSTKMRQVIMINLSGRMAMDLRASEQFTKKCRIVKIVLEKSLQQKELIETYLPKIFGGLFLGDTDTPTEMERLRKLKSAPIFKPLPITVKSTAVSNMTSVSAKSFAEQLHNYMDEDSESSMTEIIDESNESVDEYPHILVTRSPVKVLQNIEVGEVPKPVEQLIIKPNYEKQSRSLIVECTENQSNLLSRDTQDEILRMVTSLHSQKSQELSKLEARSKEVLDCSRDILNKNLKTPEQLRSVGNEVVHSMNKLKLSLEHLDIKEKKGKEKCLIKVNVPMKQYNKKSATLCTLGSISEDEEYLDAEEEKDTGPVRILGNILIAEGKSNKDLASSSSEAYSTPSNLLKPDDVISQKNDATAHKLSTPTKRVFTSKIQCHIKKLITNTRNKDKITKEDAESKKLIQLKKVQENFLKADQFERIIPKKTDKDKVDFFDSLRMDSDECASTSHNVKIMSTTKSSEMLASSEESRPSEAEHGNTIIKSNEISGEASAGRFKLEERKAATTKEIQGVLVACNPEKSENIFHKDEINNVTKSKDSKIQKLDKLHASKTPEEADIPQTSSVLFEDLQEDIVDPNSIEPSRLETEFLNLLGDADTESKNISSARPALQFPKISLDDFKKHKKLQNADLESNSSSDSINLAELSELTQQIKQREQIDRDLEVSSNGGAESPPIRPVRLQRKQKNRVDEDIEVLPSNEKSVGEDGNQVGGRTKIYRRVPPTLETQVEINNAKNIDGGETTKVCQLIEGVDSIKQNNEELKKANRKSRCTAPIIKADDTMNTKLRDNKKGQNDTDLIFLKRLMLNHPDEERCDSVAITTPDTKPQKGRKNKIQKEAQRNDTDLTAQEIITDNQEKGKELTAIIPLETKKHIKRKNKKSHHEDQSVGANTIAQGHVELETNNQDNGITRENIEFDDDDQREKPTPTVTVVTKKQKRIKDKKSQYRIQIEDQSKAQDLITEGNVELNNANKENCEDLPTIDIKKSRRRKNKKIENHEKIADIVTNENDELNNACNEQHDVSLETTETKKKSKYFQIFEDELEIKNMGNLVVQLTDISEQIPAELGNKKIINANKKGKKSSAIPFEDTTNTAQTKTGDNDKRSDITDVSVILNKSDLSSYTKKTGAEKNKFSLDNFAKKPVGIRGETTKVKAKNERSKDNMQIEDSVHKSPNQNKDPERKNNEETINQSVVSKKKKRGRPKGQKSAYKVNEKIPEVIKANLITNGTEAGDNIGGIISTNNVRGMSNTDDMIGITGIMKDGKTMIGDTDLSSNTSISKLLNLPRNQAEEFVDASDATTKRKGTTRKPSKNDDAVKKNEAEISTMYTNTVIDESVGPNTADMQGLEKRVPKRKFARKGSGENLNTTGKGVDADVSRSSTGEYAKQLISEDWNSSETNAEGRDKQPLDREAKEENALSKNVSHERKLPEVETNEISKESAKINSKYKKGIVEETGNIPTSEGNGNNIMEVSMGNSKTKESLAAQTGEALLCSEQIQKPSEEIGKLNQHPPSKSNIKDQSTPKEHPTFSEGIDSAGNENVHNHPKDSLDVQTHDPVEIMNEPEQERDKFDALITQKSGNQNLQTGEVIASNPGDKGPKLIHIDDDLSIFRDVELVDKTKHLTDIYIKCLQKKKKTPLRNSQSESNLSRATSSKRKLYNPSDLSYLDQSKLQIRAENENAACVDLTGNAETLVHADTISNGAASIYKNILNNDKNAVGEKRKRSCLNDVDKPKRRRNDPHDFDKNPEMPIENNSSCKRAEDLFNSIVLKMQKSNKKVSGTPSFYVPKRRSIKNIRHSDNFKKHLERISTSKIQLLHQIGVDHEILKKPHFRNVYEHLDGLYKAYEKGVSVFQDMLAKEKTSKRRVVAE